MPDDPPLYTIRPRPARDGYSLAGPLLPNALWYDTASDALSMARNHYGPMKGARIEVYGPDGELYKVVEVEKALPKGGSGMSA